MEKWWSSFFLRGFVFEIQYCLLIVCDDPYKFSLQLSLDTNTNDIIITRSWPVKCGIIPLSCHKIIRNSIPVDNSNINSSIRKIPNSYSAIQLIIHRNCQVNGNDDGSFHNWKTRMGSLKWNHYCNFTEYDKIDNSMNLECWKELSRSWYQKLCPHANVWNEILIIGVYYVIFSFHDNIFLISLSCIWYSLKWVE